MFLSKILQVVSKELSINYKDNCTLVYKFNGTNWMITPFCSIENGTDEFKAVLKCNSSYNVIGVSCKINEPKISSSQ